MKIIDIILNEAREAPLYHFTSEDKFFRILSTDTLLGRDKIYFTRDYGRQFIPAAILKGSWGFRVNQDLLHQRFGKKLQAGGQQTGWDEKKRQAWLADPKNADTIAKVKAGEPSGLSLGGASVNDIIAGTTGKASRWESEEHLYVPQVPNFHEYITGIVYSGGTHIGQYDHGHDFKKRNPRQSEALDELCQYLMGHFKGDVGFKQRDALIEYMTKFSIPFVYQQQDFEANAVKSRMIQIWRERKAERARRDQEVKNYYTVIKNKEGGGLSMTAPTAEIAVDRALKEFPHKFPDGVFGVRASGEDVVWFDTPLTAQTV